MLEGVPPFAPKPEITLNAAARALVTSIETLLPSLVTLATNQMTGGAEFHAGTGGKEMYVEEMLVYLRAMSKIARELPQETYPGVREKFRLPRQTSYLALVATARSFVTQAGEIKAVFVAHGLPADFDEKITEMASEVEGAIVDQTGGRTTQVGSTAGLAAKAREGVKLVRRLDGILSFQLRNDPVLLAEWLSVSHIDMSPRRKNEEEETPTAQLAPIGTLGPLAAVTQGSAMPVLNGHRGEVEDEIPTLVERG